MRKPRKYRLVRRAERSEETRHRIARAALDLHSSLGPARTSISAIARRAGVQRLTVYRHFPTQRELFNACSGLARTIHPAPNPAAWSRIADPEARLRLALSELYAHYKTTASLHANVLRDAEINSLVREVASPRLKYLGDCLDTLAQGWTTAKNPQRLVRVAHALQFRTWESLVDSQRLRRAEAVDLMVNWVVALARPGSPKTALKRAGR